MAALDGHDVCCGPGRKKRYCSVDAARIPIRPDAVAVTSAKENVVQLYSLPLSPYSARVRGAIYAKGLPVQIVSPPEQWRTSPEYRSINPLGRIPVLMLDDGTPLPESSVIVEYLEDAFPEPALRPRCFETLARVRLVTEVADRYVMQVLMPLFNMLDARRYEQAVIDAEFATLNEGFTQLDRLLEPGAYVCGDRLTTADVWLTPVRFCIEAMSSFAGRPQLLDGHKALRAYSGVIQSDPHLGRVWREMQDALTAFMQPRASVMTEAV
jgi:glutathione S-transferase